MLSKFKFLHFIFFFFVGVFGVIVLFKWNAVGAQTGNMVSCYKISLVQNKTETVPVLVSGIANSGTYQFSEPIDYGACVLKESAENLLIQGWTWNTNLGWMSFLCAGGTNSGINCGSTPYSVSLNTKIGELSGYAWGDNIGWISMKCKGGKNGTTDCGTVDYGVRVALADGEISGSDNGNCGTMKKGDMYGYAWTDTVGWMDFCGGRVDLSALETPPDTTPPIGTGTTTPPTNIDTNPPYMETYPPELPAYQVAQVIGNVRANMIVDTKNLPIKNWISYPIGETISSSRERFLRTAKKSSVGLTPDLFDFGNTKTVNTADLLPQSTQKTKLLYFKRNKNITEPCKIIFGDTGEIQYGQQKNKSFTTIVSEGCDIYIDQNLRSKYREKDGAGQEVPKSRLGIIAFSDLSMAGERKGGNVYICSRVTDVESHLVMDGSLFSYGEESEKGGMDCDDKDSLVNQYNGLPALPTSPGSIKSLLRNQLVIVGMFLGNNTYGGSTADKPALGDGTIIVGTSSGDIAKARLFDVNFLRYADVETSAVDSAQLCWSKGTQLAKYLLPTQYQNKKQSDLVKIWEKICETNFPIGDDRLNPKALTTIMYMDPTADLPIFNGMVGKK